MKCDIKKQLNSNQWLISNYIPVHVAFVRISFDGFGKFQLCLEKVNYSKVHVYFRLVLAEQFLKQTLCFKQKKTADNTQKQPTSKNETIISLKI